MKKHKQLLILCTVLIGLCGGLYVLQVKGEGNTVEESMETGEIVLSLKEEEMKQLTIKDKTNEVVLKPVKESIEIEGEEPNIYYTWQLQLPEQVEVEQDKINSVGEKVLHIEAVKKIEASDLESFGLNEPQLTINYETLTDDRYTLVVGDQTIDGNGYYAMLNEQPDTVYIIETYQMSDVSPRVEDYRNKMIGTIPTDTLTELTISGQNIDTYAIHKVDDAMLFAPNELPIPVDPTIYNTLLGKLPRLQVESFVDDQVQDLGIYGLDNPSLTLAVDYTEMEEEIPIHKEVSYKWGNVLEDGTIYFMKEGTSSVYTMDASFVEPLKEMLDVFKLSNKYVYMPAINEIESVDVQIGNKIYNLDIKREEVTMPATEEETETTEVQETYFINDKEINEDVFKDVYQKLIAIVADTELKNEKAENLKEEVVTITYNDLEGKEVKVAFYPYDNQFYSTSLGGNYVVGCNKKQFGYIEKALDELIVE